MARENILLVGSPGTGKTHLATALGIEACHRGKKVRFYRVTELITQMMEAREERTLSRIKGQLAKLDLLILDELGYVPASRLGAELLFDVISVAYERTSVIVTTKSALRTVGGGARLRASDRRHARSANPSLPRARSQWPELPPQGRHPATQRAMTLNQRRPEPGGHPNPTRDTVTPGAARLARPALHF